MRRSRKRLKESESLKVEGDKVDGVESTNSASLGQPGVRARKCVREDRVAEGVPAPRGKRFEVRGLGGNSPMNSNTISKGQQGSI
jgi:hypothetical protein